jgi:hypothetical protein
MRQSIRFIFLALVLASLAIRITHPKGFRHLAVAADPSPPVTHAVTALPPVQPILPTSSSEFLHAQFVEKQEERFHELQTRLHLNLEQSTAIRQAMQIENKENELLAQNGDPSQRDSISVPDPKLTSVDRTLWKVLTPDQAAIYEKMEEDQEEADDKANAKLEASAEADQYSMLLDLSAVQKAQVYDALYQIQIDMRKASLSKLTDEKMPAFLPLEKAGSQAEEEALGKILTPAQLNEYRQYQSQIQQEVMKEVESHHASNATL